MDAQSPPLDLVSFALDTRRCKDISIPLFIDAQKPTRTLNASQITRLVRTLVGGFQALGLETEDRVLVHMTNNVLYTAIFLGIVGAGGTYIGSNPLGSDDEFEHILDLAKPSLIITETSALDMVLRICSRKGISEGNILSLDEEAIDKTIHLFHSNAPTPTLVLSDHTSNTSPHGKFYQLLNHGEQAWRQITDEHTSKTRPAVIFTTSGTSGLPKAALHSHYAIILRHLSIAYDVPFEARRLIALHLFHPFGFLWTHFFAVRYGEPVYILPRFQTSTFLAAIRQFQITETYIVPVMVQLILQSALSAEHPIKDALQSLRLVGVSGETIDREAMGSFQRLLHRDSCAAQLWGMAETGVVFQTRYSTREMQYDLGSIGAITPGYEARLMTEETNDIVHADGCAGQLFVRGAALMLGYQGRGSDIDADGWFSTGDVAYRKDGHYYIVGRIKEIMKVRGYQVAPAEIEAVLMKNPSISDAAITAVRLADGVTEAPRAYIVRNPVVQNDLTEADVYSLVKDQLASYKTLDGGVVFVDSIPRTVTGKVARKELSQLDAQRNHLVNLLV